MVRLEPATGVSGDSEATPSDREGGQKGDSRWPTIKRQWPAALCFAVYVVLAMVLYGHFGSLGSGHMTGTSSSDAIAQVWWLAWTAFALPHGHNLFSAQWQNYPAGQNFGVNGSMLALGVLFMPITKLFGPVVTWNIALRLAVALSASSMCLVLRRWTTWWPAAFVGGLIYGFSAYIAFYGNLPVSYFRAATPRDLPSPLRDHGAPAVAAGKNRGAPRSGVYPPVLHLVRGPCSTVVMGVVAVVLFAPRPSPPGGRTTALRGAGLRLQPRCGRPAAHRAGRLRVNRSARHQGTDTNSAHRVVSERPVRRDRAELPMAQYDA